ncbi:MAG: DUF5906 domain-containing protein [Phycisphaerales bacterium]
MTDPRDQSAGRWEDAADGGGGGERQGAPQPGEPSRGGGGRLGGVGDRTPFGQGGGTGWWDGTTAEWFDESGEPLRRPILQTDHLLVAREFLVAEFAVPKAPHFGLQRWGGKFWVYERGGYAERSLEEMVNRVQHWLGGCDKRMKRQKKPVVVSFSPTREFCAAVVASLSTDTFCAGVRELPAWLPPTRDAVGLPVWGVLSRLTDQAWRTAGEQRTNPANRLIYENGAVDLAEIAETGRLHIYPHTPALFSMAALPYALPMDALRELLAGPDSGPERRALEERVYSRICPGWWEFVKSISMPPDDANAPKPEHRAEAASEDGCSDLPEDDRPPAEPDWEFVDHVQETFGDTLDPDRSIEVANALVGDKRTGKDTMLLGVSTVLGDGNWCALSPQDFSDRFGLYKVVGKKAALMGEMDLGKHDDPTGIMATIKMMSGRSPMSVRDLYSPAMDIRNGARVWIASNSLPTSMRDQSGAYASRLNVIRMRRSWIGKERVQVKGNVPLEGPGISVWALMGAVIIRRRAAREGRRYIAEHSASVELREKYERVSSTLRVYMRECCELGETHEEPFDQLYNAYTHFCADEGVQPTGKARFSMDMAVLVPWYRRGQPVKRGEDGEAKRRRVVYGIRLRYDVDTLWRTAPHGKGGEAQNGSERA